MPVRAFVALPLPPGHRNALAAYLEACAGQAPGLRWVLPENLHLTLRFLGATGPERLEALRAELAGVRLPGFELALGGLGTFGGSRPRVVWLGLASGEEQARRLADAVEAACLASGAEPEERPFRPHLTLARARDRKPEPLPTLRPPPALEPWRPDRFVLYESRLGGGPARYLELASFALGE